MTRRQPAAAPPRPRRSLRALGSGEALDAGGSPRARRCGRCRGPAGWMLRSAPCAAPGRGSRRLRRSSAVETLGDLLLHVPHRYRDRSRGPDARRAADRRAGHGGGRGAIGSGSPDPAAAGCGSWRRRRRRERPGDRGLVQPGVARGSPRAGDAAAAAREARAGPVPGRRARVRGGGSSGIHTTGLVPVHPATEGLTPKRIRDWAWQAMPLARHAIEPLPAELRARRRLAGAADALAAAHFPDRLVDAERRARAAGVRGALPAPGGARGAPPADGEASRPGVSARSAPGELVDGWLRSLPFELTGDQRARDRGDRRRPRRRASRCSGC